LSEGDVVAFILYEDRCRIFKTAPKSAGK